MVYKRFIDDAYSDAGDFGSAHSIRTNNQYKQQLKSNFNCDQISDARYNLMEYKESYLQSYFVDYNYCVKSPVKVLKGRKNMDSFNVNLRLGLNHNAFFVENNVQSSSAGILGDYGSSISIRYGVELEFFLPVNNRKWSIFVEPTYQKFSGKKDGDVIYSIADYTTVEVPTGFRHYSFLTGKLKLFFNASIAFVFNLDSKILVFRNDNGVMTGTREINGTEEFLSVGLGYNYNDKFGVEFRYNTKRDLLGDTKYYTSDFDENFSIILGYTIL